MAIDVTVICGGGISSISYHVTYYGGRAPEDLSFQGRRRFNSGEIRTLKIYCDAGDITDHSRYTTPLLYEWHYRDSTVEHKGKFVTGTEFDSSDQLVFKVSATEIPDNDVKYDWDGGEDGPSNEKKKKGETYYIPSKKPKRSGYVFRYWTDNLGTGKHWLPGDAYTRDSDVTFKAMWAAKSYFYWHGSNENDATYFQVDKRVDLAITASNWNRFCYYVNLLRDYCYLPTITFTSVSAENELSASEFNKVSNAIEDCVNYARSAVHPPTVSKGMLVRVLHYNGPGSLKDAATSVMNALE
jgi:hypothetical protein